MVSAIWGICFSLKANPHRNTSRMFLKYPSAECGRGNFPPCVEQIPEPAHVQTLIPQPAVEVLHVRVLRGRTRLDVNGVDALLDMHQARQCLEATSGPLSLRIAAGAPRVSMICANALVTRRLGRDVSTSRGRHSRMGREPGPKTPGPPDNFK